MATVLERQLKRIGLFGLSRLATAPRQKPTESDLASVVRILVVRPDERIGNAILIIPLLDALKKRFPKAHVALVMSRRYWELREFIPSVDEFIAFDKIHYARSPLAFVHFVRQLRRGNFDLVFDASGDHSVSFTHLALTAYSGGRFRIGHDRGEASRCYEVAVLVSTEPRHETERHLDLLRAISKIDADPRPLLKHTEDNGYAAKLWQEFRWDEGVPTVIIHPGARGRKRWPSDHFAQVAERLAARDNQVGVVWGPSDHEAGEAVLQASPKTVKRIGVLSFRDFVSVIRKADVFFSGDCGPMHLAAATPPKQGVVTVFVIDQSARYGPLGPHDVTFVDDSSHSPVDEIANSVSALAESKATSPMLRSATA